MNDLETMTIDHDQKNNYDNTKPISINLPSVMRPKQYVESKNKLQTINGKIP